MDLKAFITKFLLALSGFLRCDAVSLLRLSIGGLVCSFSHLSTVETQLEHIMRTRESKVDPVSKTVDPLQNTVASMQRSVRNKSAKRLADPH